MKILFVTYDFPLPDNSGGKTRALNMIKYGSNGIEVYLYSFIRQAPEPKYIDEIKSIGVKDIYYTLRKKVGNFSSLSSILVDRSVFKSLYYSDSAEKQIIEIIRKHKIDVVHFESYYTGFYIGDKIKQLPVKTVFGSENIEFNIYKDISRNHYKPHYKYYMKTQVGKIKKEEESMMRDSDLVLAVNKSEFEYIKGFNSNVSLIPNGVIRNNEINKRTKSDGTVLFVGNFTYYPNIDAIEHFITQIMPNTPNVKKLIVIGKGSSKYSNSNIDTHEFVEHKSDLYLSASIMVSPIRIGGGTNFKVIESLSFGTPVVAYRDRVEGLDLKDDREILLADGITEFKNKLGNLIKDESIYKELSVNGRKVVESKYNWDNIGRDLNSAWMSLS